MSKLFKLDLPSSPGVYRFLNGEGKLIYVGKAKNLKRRIAQYRNAKRCKAHAKMRKLKKETHQILFETCPSEVEALLLETELIQAHRPKWNVSGAFFFLYPMLGIKREQGMFYLCYTTYPESFSGFDLHGAFRSRARTRDCFYALVDLLKLIGHSLPHKQLFKNDFATIDPKKGKIYGFRQVPDAWQSMVDAFLKGESFDAIQDLALMLLDRPTALANSKDTEEKLHQIRAFWRHEATSLKKAIGQCPHFAYPVSQKDRDLLFISYRARV